MIKSGKILVVDDDRELLQALREQLKGRGYKSRFAATGSEALKIAAKLGDLDLLLTDVLLPDLSGMELARTLRDKQPGLQVAFMSGYLRPALGESEEPDWQDATFIQKPFSIKTLSGFIKRTLRNDPAAPNLPKRHTPE